MRLTILYQVMYQLFATPHDVISITTLTVIPELVPMSEKMTDGRIKTPVISYLRTLPTLLSGIKTGSVATQPPTLWVYGNFSPGIKRQESEHGHLPPSSADVRNAWSSTSTPACLHGVVLN
jgi:hypothetical protein